MNQNHGQSDDSKRSEAQFVTAQEPLQSSCEDCIHLRIGNADDASFAACNRLEEFLVEPAEWEPCALHAMLMNFGCKYFEARGSVVTPQDIGRFLQGLLPNLWTVHGSACGSGNEPPEEPDNEGYECECSFYETYLDVDRMIRDLEVYAEILTDDKLRGDFYADLNRLRMYIRHMVLGDEECDDDDEEEEGDEDRRDKA